mgnify:CR=1 FL=1
MNFPDSLKYTKDHEWVQVDGEHAWVGITDFAQSELGDIVYVEIETEGDALQQGDAFGSVEAVKTVSDLYMPVSGEVVEVNSELEDAPEKVNEEPYGNGWMVKIKMSDPSQVDALMAATDYESMVS